jgi:hypothetical protein
VRLEHEVDGLAHGCERRIRQRPLGKDRRIARRYQQDIALAQGDLEPFGQMQHHVAARQRPAGLQKAQMLRRDIGLASEVELAQVPALPPLAQKIAHRSRRRQHGATIADAASRLHYLRLNRPRAAGPAIMPEVASTSRCR